MIGKSYNSINNHDSISEIATQIGNIVRTAAAATQAVELQRK
jgi:hypothetical protein